MTEEQENCKYCHSPYKPCFSMVDKDGVTDFGVFRVVANNDKVLAELNYSYCPNCGRKLADD